MLDIPPPPDERDLYIKWFVGLVSTNMFVQITEAINPGQTKQRTGHDPSMFQDLIREHQARYDKAIAL